MMLSKEIERIFTEHANEHLFSGTGLVKIGETLIFSGAFGYANRTWKIPNALDTRFDTASITKLFTTVAVLQLIDRGGFDLDTSVVDFLELRDTTISNRVTVFQLLTHTSGIGDDADEEAGEDYEAIWKDRPTYSVRETKDFLPQFANKPPVFEPGAACRYNNVGFILLGLMIEASSGQSYRDYVRAHILEPLGMTNTAFLNMDGVFDRVAEGYAPIYVDSKISGWRKNIFSYPPIGSPDAGAYSTVEDLDRFLRTVGTILSPKFAQELFSPKTFYRERETRNLREYIGFCFHFLTTTEDEVIFFKKDGDNTGVSCCLSFYPKADVSIVILANQDCDVWEMSWKINDLLLASEFFRSVR